MKKNKIDIKEEKSKEYDWWKIIGFLGAIIFFCSAIFYLFCTDSEVHYNEYVVFLDETLNDTPAVWYFLSYSANNEFIVGQPVHIEAYIFFTNEESYNKFKPDNKNVNLFISGAAPPKSSTNWFESSVINISETNDPLRKELQVPFVIDKYLKGTNDVIFQESGTQEVFIHNTNGTKIPISNINISPRTIGYEIKNNKLIILFALIGFILTFFSLIKSEHRS